MFTGSPASKQASAIPASGDRRPQHYSFLVPNRSGPNCCHTGDSAIYKSSGKSGCSTHPTAKTDTLARRTCLIACVLTGTAKHIPAIDIFLMIEGWRDSGVNG